MFLKSRIIEILFNYFDNRMSPTVLDHVNNIVLVPEFSTIKNCHALKSLKLGLWTLASGVRTEEIRNSKRLLMAISMDERDFLIACYFHWFAISLVNYIRLIGFVDVMQKNRWAIERLQEKSIKSYVKLHCKNYINSVPEVEDILAWRNKVAAHFAATDPWEKDNIGTLQDSIQHPITYCRPYYYAHRHTFGLGGIQSDIPGWSLTQTFESLGPRYWTNYKLQQFDEVE